MSVPFHFENRKDKYNMLKDAILLPQYASDVFPAGDGAYTAIMPQVTEGFFRRYRSKLEDAGFQKHTENEFCGSGEEKRNLFATYLSDDVQVDLGYHENMGRMYVTFSPRDGKWSVSPSTPPAYEALGDTFPTTLTQLGCERFYPTEAAMCYILRAADGGFVIIDSAMGDGVEDFIYRVLKKQAPDPDRIRIHAWILTHPHGDHVFGFLAFANKFATDPSIILEQLVCNFADDSMVVPGIADLQKNIITAARSFGENVTFCKPHAGNILYYADLTFRVLYTQEEYLATRPTVVDPNCSSLVLRMTTADGSSVLFGADHPVCGSYNGYRFCEGALYRWYGDAIRSDVVTVFHHGYGGGADMKIYPTIHPRLVLWPANIARFYHDDAGNPYPTAIPDTPYNRYFTDPEEAKKNGVEGYYPSGDTVTVLTFADQQIQIQQYEDEKEYFS